MDKKVEVLLAIMNIDNEQQYREKIKENRIKGKVVAVNQIENNKEIFNIDNKEQRIFSYKEKGASRSRNRLLQKAEGDICIFADDDTKYVDGYENIIKNEFEKNPKADILIFFVENINSEREKNKRIGNKKVNLLDCMRVRTYEIAIKKESLEKIKKMRIQFDTNFGPTGVFHKGEETIFIAELLKNYFKIYSVNKRIGTVENRKSTWFTGVNEKYLYDQGAIFYRIAPKIYKLLIIQYVVRKYFEYRKNVNMINAYKQMNEGTKKCKEIYNNKN